ncbi:MAG: hypothetical protein ACQETK_11065 [Pseudomonadota bacterium]
MSTRIEVDTLRPLAEAARGNGAPSPEADTALGLLEQELNAIAEALRLEYVGPGVGMADMQAEHVYRLVIREHEHNVAERGWGVMVCDALPNCDYRPMWPMTGVGRLRRKQVVAALPELLHGYREAVARGGREDTEAAQRLATIAALFATD